MANKFIKDFYETFEKLWQSGDIGYVGIWDDEDVIVTSKGIRKIKNKKKIGNVIVHELKEEK